MNAPNQGTENTKVLNFVPINNIIMLRGAKTTFHVHAFRLHRSLLGIMGIFRMGNIFVIRYQLLSNQ